MGFLAAGFEFESSVKKKKKKYITNDVKFCSKLVMEK